MVDNLHVSHLTKFGKAVLGTAPLFGRRVELSYCTERSRFCKRLYAFFTNLPVELQSLIWTFTISNPRAISGESCFREWWHRAVTPFLVPVALHVCCHSRLIASRALKRSFIKIPCVPKWSIIYVNQACDYFIITGREIQNYVILSKFITDPSLITRVVISKDVARNKALLAHDINRCFDQLRSLREVILIDEAQLYLVQQQRLLFRSGFGIPQERPNIRLEFQFYFENRGIEIKYYYIYISSITAATVHFLCSKAHITAAVDNTPGHEIKMLLEICIPSTSS
jgi:hypothetical protein